MTATSSFGAKLTSETVATFLKGWIEGLDLNNLSNIRFVKDIVAMAMKVPPGYYTIFGNGLSAFIKTNPTLRKSHPHIAEFIGDNVDDAFLGIDNLFKNADKAKGKINEKELTKELLFGLTLIEERQVPAMKTFMQLLPLEKRGAYTGLWLLGYKYRRWDHVSELPGDIPPLNPIAAGLDSKAAELHGAIRHKITNDPEGLVHQLPPNITFNQVLEDPEEHASELISVVLGDYKPSMGEWLEDKIDGLIDKPKLKNWLEKVLKRILEGYDVGPLLESMRGRAVTALKAVIAVYLSIWAILLLFLVPSGLVFVGLTLKLLLFEPPTFEEALPMLAVYILSIVGIIVARFVFPIFDMIHGGVASAFSAVNPLDEGSAGGVVINFVTSVMESQRWLSKAAAAKVRTAAEIAKDHPIWLKRGLTVSIVALIAGLLVFTKIQYDYGAHMGVMIFAVMAGIGLAAEATKLASVRFGKEYVINFAQNIADTLNKRFLFGLIAVMILMGFAIIAFPSVSADAGNKVRQREDTEQTQSTKNERKKPAKGEIPEYCFFKNYDPKNGKLPGCP